MSKTQYYCAASLDGYIAETDDGLEWLTAYEPASSGAGDEPPPMSEGGTYERFYEEIGALVSGSVTYEWVLEHSTESWPYPSKPWWVLSSRELPIPGGEGVDVRIVDGNAAELHGEMLASANGRNLWVVGGGGVASQFADAGLLDEVSVTVVPVVLGDGKQLFDRPLAGAPMELLGVSAFQNGMVELRYAISR